MEGREKRVELEEIRNDLIPLGFEKGKDGMAMDIRLLILL
jgi:hypothetical protein